MAIRVGIQHVADTSDATKILSHMLGLARTQVSVDHVCANCGATDHGQPFLLIDGERAAQRISISRTSHWMAVALSEGRNPNQSVGVDVETVKRVSRHDVHDVAFSANESQAVASLEEFERAPAATQIWTAKEAVTKLLGVGLRAELSELECSVVGPVIDECTVTHRDGEAIVNFFSPHAGVLVAVASAAPEPVVWLTWGR